MKSLRFGFAFDLHRVRCPRCIEILLLIAALACYALYLVGLQARMTGRPYRFQSNRAVALAGRPRIPEALAQRFIVLDTRE
ncbi:hypothetical protein M2262_005116 [Pseudomonas sp. BIGb0408]|uniref:Uncharacterized protein n=1 Tax=Phytopseudomonas flavescens TaxID=29435 RepID=A0A7Y9XQG6_9GAMM|nr:hypothetical protein [Pseudomonas sp. BIGb0408]NYH75660.1 hypothetical protein [Pseudomonas flavescens]